MCASAMQDSRIRKHLRMLGITKLPEGVDLEQVLIEVFPHLPGLVVIESGGERKSEQMEFSFISKSEEQLRDIRYATFNARLDAVAVKATWKNALTTHRCIVPLSEFHEPAYWGPLAGNMIRYASEEPLFAAGLWKRWRNPKDGTEVSSFAIIVHDAYPIVEEHGHDRSPVFLDEEGAKEWIREGTGTLPGPKLVEFLESRRARPALDVSVQRPLKAGWEKRVPAKYKARSGTG
jgi:putative SOS response-associated peptidase YedK